MPSPTIERLLTGFKNFRRNYYVKNQALFQALAWRGQSPKVMVIGCCDARVDPMLITGAGPGEIFMLRNVANLVPPYAPDSRSHGTSAALEFAVKSLQVEHIIVLGHAACGGVRALLNEVETAAMDTDFIANWMSIAAGPFRVMRKWRNRSVPTRPSRSSENVRSTDSTRTSFA